MICIPNIVDSWGEGGAFLITFFTSLGVFLVLFSLAALYFKKTIDYKKFSAGDDLRFRADIYSFLKSISESQIINLNPKILFRFFTILFIFILSVFLAFVLGVFAIAFMEGFDDPPSNGMHTVNAAIKNTCILDPNRLHCPKTLEDIVLIEPETLSPLLVQGTFTYYYYPQSNEYTLIIRKGGLTQYKAAIFDPILSSEGSPDFTDVTLTKCGDEFKIQDPLYLTEQRIETLQKFKEYRKDLKIN